MYVSIRRYKTNTEQIDELMQKVEGGFLPQVRKVPGFIKYYGIDGGDGMVAFLNFFEDEAGAEESNELASKWVKENLSAYFPLPPDLTAGKIMVKSEDD